MTDPAIEGLRLAEKATPGPWEHEQGSSVYPRNIRAFGRGGKRICHQGAEARRKSDSADFDFIAHARAHYAAICKRALVAEAKLVEAHKALDACHAAYAPTAEAAQRLSVHLVEAHGADLYGKPHAETIRCAHSKLAAMQRVVEAAVAYFDAEYAVRRTLSDKAETDEEAEAVCAALKVEGDAHEAMFDAVRAYKEASRG